MRRIRILDSITAVATSVAVVGASTFALAQDMELARLTGLHGAVFVDTGEGFAPVVEELTLKLGDRVMVTGEGGALLDFGSDCTVPLAAPSLTVVTDAACTTATQGDGGGGGGGFRSFGLAVLGLGFAAAGGYMAYKFLVDENGNPISP